MKASIKPFAKPTEAEAIKLLTDLVHAYTRHPKQLQIASAKIGPTIKITIKAHADDHPKIIGKNGERHLALETIVQRIAERVGTPMELFLHEPTTGQRLPVPRWEPARQWNSKVFETLLVALLRNVLVLPFSYAVKRIDDEMSGVELRVHEMELENVRGRLFGAIRRIFRAIGRHEGRKIEMELDDPQPLPEAPKVSELAVKSIGPPVDDIEAEARARGLV